MTFAHSAQPWTLGIELTGHCDLRCKHCLRSDLATVVELPVDFVGSLLDQALVLGRPHIALTGGEVTLHSRFFDILRAIDERGLTFHFVTNGNRYPAVREGLLPFLGRSLTGFTVSLDGATQATHDRVRGKGSFHRATMAIALAVRDGFSIVVQMAVNPGNRHELEAMAELCRDLGVSLLVYAHTQPTERASRNQLAMLPEEHGALDREVAALGARVGLPVTLSSGHYDPNPLAHCQTLRHESFNVDCHGRLTFCCQLSGVAGAPKDADVIADLNERSFVEAIEAQLEAGRALLSSKLRHLAAEPDDPYRGYHCHYCLGYFGKLAHVAPSDPKRLNVV